MDTEATRKMPSNRDILDRIDTILLPEVRDVALLVARQNGRLTAVEQQVKQQQEQMGKRLDDLPCTEYGQAIARLLERTSHEAPGTQRELGALQERTSQPDPKVAVLEERSGTHRWLWTVVVGFAVSILLVVANVIITQQAIAAAIQAISGGP